MISYLCIRQLWVFLSVLKCIHLKFFVNYFSFAAHLSITSSLVQSYPGHPVTISRIPLFPVLFKMSFPILPGPIFILAPTLCLPLKIYMVWLSAKQTEKSVWKSTRTKGKTLTNYWKCSMLGKNKRTSYLPKKSAMKNTITGVTTIRSSIPLKCGRKCHHRNLVKP